MDVLVNNAGIGVLKPFMELTAAEWQRMIDVNFNALYHVTRSVLPSMIAKQSRTRLHHRVDRRAQRVRRRHVLRGDEGVVTASSESLMLELREHGVKVSVVNPGSVATDFRHERPTTELDAGAGRRRRRGRVRAWPRRRTC